MKRSGMVVAALALSLGIGSTSAALEKTAPAPASKKPSVKMEQQDPSGALSGKVVETMNAGGYTYVCLEKGGKKSWVAVPEMKVTVGSQMSFMPGQAMPNFTSKSLGRTFDSIVFSGGPVASSGKSPAGIPGHPPVTGSKVAASAKDKTIKVEKATGPNAYSVGEVYAKRAALNKKTVVVKGQVVKISKGIMGKNWIHLQDGTGDASKGTHNLVATSQDSAAVGDVVTVTGTFAKDKDFGAGYLYKAIVEDATVQK